MPLNHDAWLLQGAPDDDLIACPECQGAGSIDEFPDALPCPTCDGSGECTEIEAQHYATTRRE